MPTRIRTLLLLAAMASAPSALSQVNPQFADLTTAVEEARTAMGMERKNLVLQALNLTPDEAAKFWPLYDQYMLDMKKVGDLRVKLITDFAASYDNLSEDTANQLLNDGLRYNENLNDLRKGYLRKFKKVLPATKMARFYQLDAKLDAITNFALARQIPLVPQAPSSKPLSPPAG